MTMRLRSSTPNQTSRSQLSPPYSLPLPIIDDPHNQIQDRRQPSNPTSANTSRQASNASIYSMPFHTLNRHSTPPTPLSSPSSGLYRPPEHQHQAPVPGTDDATDVVQYLHPSQYRQTGSVRETHQLETDYDPISGRKTINNYSIIDEIGRGTHGKVKLGYDLLAGKHVAIKIVERSQGRPRLGRKGDGGESSETKIRREIAILKKIRHENVVRLLEVIDDARSKKVYLVLEYVVRGEVIWRQNGDLDILRRDRQRLKREIGADREKSAVMAAAASDVQQQHNLKHKRRRRKKHSRGMSFWSLEFGSDSNMDSDIEEEGTGSQLDDLSDAESILSAVEEEFYIPAMDIGEARRCFRDTVVGLDHLHWNGIIHRDIKPANLLWTDDKVTKISDFGVSFLGRPRREDDDEETGDEEPTGFEQDELELAKTAGTPAFFAPELCCMDPANSKVSITSAIDVWALGVTLFCFIFGRLPFVAEHEFKLFKCIAEEELVIPRRRIRAHRQKLDPYHRLSPEELEDYETEPVGDDLRDLIKRLLTKNPSKRILLKEVKRHPWVLHGIQDPIGWVERTDPERISHGNKIEVTIEDVETAVSVPSIVNKAFRWVRGLRKRASSTNSKDSKGKQVDSGSHGSGDLAGGGAGGGGGGGGGKQGQPIFRYNDDPDRELQWMGGMGISREDEKLNPLAPSVTNSSANSSETIQDNQIQTGDDHEYHDQQWTAGITGGHWKQSSPTNDKKLRRKRSMGLLGSNLLRRHSSHVHDSTRAIRASHRTPIEPPPTSPVLETPPHMFKAESTAALVAPSISRKIMRSTKSDDLARDSGAPRTNSLYGGGGGGGEGCNSSRAKDVLNEALHARSNGPDYDTLPTHTPQPMSLYKVVGTMENGPLNTNPRSPGSNLKLRIERQRREEQEQARRRLGKLNIDDDDEALNSPDDDETPSPRAYGSENQRIIIEESEERYTPNDGSPLSSRIPEGWSQEENVFCPSRDYATPPIAMGFRNRGYFDPPSPKSGSHGANLVSSSSDERFATTAGSSLTNSASFPSVATNPSSVSSDMFLNQYSRKGSFVPTEHSLDAIGIDEDDRFRLIHARARGRRASELLFQPEEDENSGSDSEGGFVMRPRGKKPRSVTIGELARESGAYKDAAIRSGNHPRHHSRSSGGTVRMDDGSRRRSHDDVSNP